jgi:hypothetical protein
VKAKPHLLRPETQSVILPGLLPRWVKREFYH